MDWQTLFNIAISVCGMAGVPLLKFIWDRIESAKQESMTLGQEGKTIALDALRRHNEFRQEATEKFVSMAHFDKFETRLFAELEKITDKLDSKQDREK